MLDAVTTLDGKPMDFYPTHVEGGAKKDPPTSFPPVTSVNVEIRPQNF